MKRVLGVVAAATLIGFLLGWRAAELTDETPFSGG